MTYDELVTALTDAIDQPNPTPPPAIIEGSAGDGDEIQAGLLLERLVATKGRLDGATAGLARVNEIASDLLAQFEAESAAWYAGRTAHFDELDRSTRAVETLIRATAPLDPDDLPHYFDDDVDGMDPGTAGDIGDSAAAIYRAKLARAVGKRYRLQAPILGGLEAATRLFEGYRTPPVENGSGPRLLHGARSQLASANAAYSRAFTEAVAFVEYLEIAP